MIEPWSSHALFGVLHCLHLFNASIEGHLEPTHLKSSPLVTFSTKSLGQDSPSVHLFSLKIGSRFTAAKIFFVKDTSLFFTNHSNEHQRHEPWAWSARLSAALLRVMAPNTIQTWNQIQFKPWWKATIKISWVKIHQADFFFLGQDSLSDKQNNKPNKMPVRSRFTVLQILLVKDSTCWKIN